MIFIFDGKVYKLLEFCAHANDLTTKNTINSNACQEFFLLFMKLERRLN